MICVLNIENFIHVTTSMKFHFPICTKALLVPAYMLLISDLISMNKMCLIYMFSSLLILNKCITQYINEEFLSKRG